MRQLIIIFVSIFLLIWAIGLFFGFLSGVKNVKLPETRSPISGAAQIETQKRLATDAKDLEERTRQDFEFQTQQYKTSPQLPSQHFPQSF